MINLMIDIETTGVDPTENAIIQIGAIPFDLEGNKGLTFCKSLTVPAYRKWNKDTLAWWEETNPSVLREIESEEEDFLAVLVEFRDYVECLGDIKFWSNHPFDWDFLNDYFKTYNVRRPYKYDAFRDVDTYIVAMVGEENLKKYKPIADKSREHNALYDCELQIIWLVESIKKRIN